MRPVHLKLGDIAVRITLFKPATHFFLCDVSSVTLVLS